MRRIVTSLVAVAGGCLLFAQDALAMHVEGSMYGSSTASSSGFPWNTVALWGGVGVAVVLLGTWLLVEGRRHHWHPPHRPITHT